MITVIIADDHSKFRQGIARLLAGECDITLLGEAASGLEALRLIDELHPDVAVLDISMPLPDGIEITRQLCARQSATACLILSMHDDADTIRRAADAGARGYLVKEGAFEGLASAIRKTNVGNGFVCSSGRVEQQH